MKPQFLVLFIALLCCRAPILLCQEQGVSDFKEKVITANNYCSFLNERAENQLLEGASILRLGEPGGYRYELAPMATLDTPMLFLSWNDAAQYCEWKNTSISYLPSSSFHMDRLLKTSYSTFQLVSSEASAHQAVGPEEIQTFSEFCYEILKVAFGITSVVSVSGRPETEETHDHPSGRDLHLIRTTLEEPIDSQEQKEACTTLNERPNISSMNKIGKETFIPPAMVEEKPLSSDPAESGKSVYFKNEESEPHIQRAPNDHIPFKQNIFLTSSIAVGSTTPHSLKQVPSESHFYEEKLTEYTLQFAQIGNRLVRALKNLPKDDTRPTRIAALHEAAYPEARSFVQETFLSIQNDPAFRKQELAVKFLADATIKVINIAAKSVDPKNFRLIKKERFFKPDPRSSEQNKPVFATPPPTKKFSPLFETLKVPLEKMHDEGRERADPEDVYDDWIILTANNAIENLEDAKNALISSPDTILDIQKKRALRADQNAYQKLNSIYKEINFLKKLCDQDPEMLSKLHDDLKDSIISATNCTTKLQAIEKSNPIIGRDAEIKEIVIHELLALIQPGLDAADRLIAMLLQRKFHHL